jgi:hypothetical protein
MEKISGTPYEKRDQWLHKGKTYRRIVPGAAHRITAYMPTRSAPARKG